MKRYRTSSTILILLGIILMCFSGFRWLQIYSDPSSAFFGMIIGGVLVVLGYLNQRVCDNFEETSDLHVGLDCLNSLTRLGFEKLDEKFIQLKGGKS